MLILIEWWTWRQVDVERAELQVLKGIAAADWPLIRQVPTLLIIITIINMLMPVQQYSFTHIRVLLVLTDCGIWCL
jgi:hypothetical protein